MRHLILLGLLFYLGMNSKVNALTISPLFSDHMVLQREKPVRIWGEAPAAQKITVSLLGQHYLTQSDHNGDWEIVLPAHDKAGPFTLTVEADESKTLHDVYYGEVWIASGQSNMEWKLKGDVVGNQQEIITANRPLIRFFDIPDTVAATKQRHLPDSHWQVASPHTVGYFSAVAWFFARKLQQQEDVAVGIIESNWGGTPAESWIDLDVVAATPGYAEKSAKVKAQHNWPKILADNKAKNVKKWQRIDDLEGAKRQEANGLNYDDSHWQNIELPNKTPLHHFVWLRKEFTLTNLPNSPITLSFGDIVQNAFIFINGQHLASEDWKTHESVHAIPTALLRQGTNIITLRVNSDWDNRVIVGKKGQIFLDIDGSKIDLSSHWRFNNSIEAPMPKVTNYSFTPGFVYNAMIYPLLPFTTQGVIWYQGESNINKHEYYHTLFSNLIVNWRERAQAPELPFFFVQISAYLPPSELQPDSKWAYLRDAQRQTLSVPNTAMAVSIDVGSADDLHPKQKRQVAERLWRQAAFKIYGHSLVTSGPDFVRSNTNQGAIKLEFNNAEGLRTTDNTPLKGFIIAGANKVFRKALAHIEGATVIVSHPEINKPVAVRYAWANNPIANLTNNENLPAVPFRTDDWLEGDVSAN
ncbi:glycoside hydrolase family 2, sugar binding protein [Paraglaciecola sp. T6c]|uniref:sialate O-acetylesterase n=1 Tax=Pseudoalteromonas atlantica (strain T6c / ATCC BAA-1087) TaxID=3042615 RepID=UPI00005C68F0|nr:sialate O-acetylesterase [Paraglaciecola sp. T6c]ABG40372.1 glycoside hydrolase family 2, sugar binding protein [Paraglaciecola sp. T6c]